MFDLPVNKGGLGLRSFADVAKCSFVASLVEECRRIWGGDRDFPNVSLLQELRQSILDLDLPIDVFGLEYSRPKGTIQHQLQVLLDAKRLEELKLRFPDREHLVWWENHCCDSSGAWLECIPKYSTFVVPSGRFRTALSYRFRMPAVQHIVGSVCKCSRTLDAFGHHLATGCRCGGERIATHDFLKHEVHQILKYCGKWAKVEERGVFYNTDPNSNLIKTRYHDS